MSRLHKSSAEVISPATLEEMELPEPKEQIVIKETKGRKKRTIKGQVVDVYDTFISVKLDGRKCKESFLKVDFLTGYLEIV